MIKNTSGRLKIKNLVLILLILVALFSTVYFSIEKVYAQGYDVGSEADPNRAKDNMSLFGSSAGLNNDKTLEERIVQYIGVLLSFLGIIFLVLIIISGVRWMTSGGNEEIINKARAMIKSSVIGLLIVLGSWVIANGIIQMIVNGRGNSPADHGIYDASF